MSEAKRKYEFSNRYVFAKVMRDNEDLCREIIEAILDIKIAHVRRIDVEAEFTHVEHRSVRFDVFLEGDEAAFEVEMQAYDQVRLPLRMRYYRSQLDRLFLRKGQPVAELRPVYVIFICTRDPFARGLPVYTFESSCREDRSVEFDDGAVSIVLNAAGDLSLASEPVAGLLQYTSSGLVCEGNTLCARIDEAVDEALRDEDWVSSVDWHEWEMENVRIAAEERGHAGGHAEGHAEGLAEGHAEERSENKALVDAMRKAGCPEGEIISAILSPDKEALVRKYIAENE